MTVRVLMIAIVGSIPFLELLPKMMCEDVNTGEKFVCEPKDFCDNPDITSYVDWNSSISLHNWVDQYDLTCTGNGEIGLIGSFFCVGTILAMLVFSRLGDFYGKKVVILGCSLMLIPLGIILLLSSELRTLYIVAVSLGISFGGVSVV